ncbi:RNA polymerase sigma factor [Olsenella sp. An188]|uniref:RNA polymerase sigma factor n=1 Tax=Olsenella sp. An188 TaxID=1965579 RepID=UPI001F145887|nr:sigma-70 family RNA polymerase sigma factor [Olsenella sp. An188]
MEQGVEKIVSERYADVLAYCRRHTASPEEAADACQETFLRFVRRAGAYRERGKPLAYLLTIARNVCVDLARARCEPLFRRPHDPFGARHAGVSRHAGSLRAAGLLARARRLPRAR